MENKDTPPDNPGYRIKITIPHLSEGEKTFWARIAVPMGGKGRGTYHLPESEDQLLVVFEHGDLHRPIIIGSLHNKKQEPAGEERLRQEQHEDDQVTLGSSVHLRRQGRVGEGHDRRLEAEPDHPRFGEQGRQDHLEDRRHRGQGEAERDLPRERAEGRHDRGHQGERQDGADARGVDVRDQGVVGDRDHRLAGPDQRRRTRRRVRCRAPAPASSAPRVPRPRRIKSRRRTAPVAAVAAGGGGGARVPAARVVVVVARLLVRAAVVRGAARRADARACTVDDDRSSARWTASASASGGGSGATRAGFEWQRQRQR